MTSSTMVNGYACKNCTDIDYAKKHIDPAHPKDGPYGVDAQPKPGSKAAEDTARAQQADRAPDRPAVKFGGALQKADISNRTNPGTTPPPASGRLLDVRA